MLETTRRPVEVLTTDAVASAQRRPPGAGTPDRKGPPDNRSINLARTIAALLVVAGHVRALFFVDWSQSSRTVGPAAFYFLTGLGPSAVEIFFVLSGFWVGGAVLQRVRSGTFTWRRYLIQRLSRLWIVLIPAILLALVLAEIGLHYFGHTDIYEGSAAYHNVADAHLASKITPEVGFGNIVFLQGIRVPIFGTDGPLWSLAYEFWYYILFPLLLVAVSRGSVIRRTASAVLAVAVMALVGPKILRLFPIWLMGAAVAMLAPRFKLWLVRRSGRSRAVLQLAALLAVCASLIVSHVFSRLPAMSGQILLGVTTAALVTSLVGDVPATGLFGRLMRPGAAYARASYSLYVSHLPIVTLAAALVVPLASDRWHLGPVTGLLFLAICALLVMTGLLFAAGTEFHTDRLRGWLEAVTPGTFRRTRPSST